MGGAVRLLPQRPDALSRPFTPDAHPPRLARGVRNSEAKRSQLRVRRPGDLGDARSGCQSRFGDGLLWLSIFLSSRDHPQRRVGSDTWKSRRVFQLAGCLSR